MTTRINFHEIDQLREKRLLINTTQMAQLLGVSRMTYWRWVEGKSHPRAAQLATARTKLNPVIGLIKSGRWPTPNVVSMTYEDRYQRLLDELDTTS